MQRIVVDQDFSAAPDRVYAHFAEHENLAELFGARVERLRDGTDGTRNGVGSARRLKVGPLPWFTETIAEAVPDERIVYRITQGSPLRDHEGVMSFSPSPGPGSGTRMHYEIRFRGVLPGLDRVVAPGLRRNIEKGLRRAAQGPLAA